MKMMIRNWNGRENELKRIVNDIFALEHERVHKPSGMKIGVEKVGKFVSFTNAINQPLNLSKCIDFYRHFLCSKALQNQILREFIYRSSDESYGSMIKELVQSNPSMPEMRKWKMSDSDVSDEVNSSASLGSFDPGDV